MYPFGKNNLIFILVLLILQCFAPAQNIITTIAGNGVAGYSGDNGLSTLAEIQGPYGITFDTIGNLYFADANNNCIRKINLSGTITTIAGTGIGGYNGDNISSVSAQLNIPTEVAIDKMNNLFIADESNNRIRQINSSSTISTIAGVGSAGYSGDGGMAVIAKLNNPSDVIFDNNGDFFVADGLNNVIRKILSTGEISTIAGNGTAGYSGDGGLATSAQLKYPCKIVLDKFNNLYIADAGNNCIRKVDVFGVITTIAGTGVAGYAGDGGQAISAQLNSPCGMLFDTLGNFYFADTWNNVIRKIDTSAKITTIVGTGTQGYNGDAIAALSANLNLPTGIALNKYGDLYISDYSNNRIRKVTNVGNMNGVIEPKKQEFSFSIYPNPNSGSFNIDITGKCEQLSIDVYSMLGGLVFHKENTKKIIVDDLQDGVYFVKIKGNGVLLKTEKVLVTK